MAGRPKKDQGPSELEIAIREIEGKIAAHQSALSVLLDVQALRSRRDGQVRPMPPMTVPEIAAKLARSHKKKAADAPKEQPADDLGL